MSAPTVALAFGLIALYTAGAQLAGGALMALLGPGWLWRAMLLAESILVGWLTILLRRYDGQTLGLRPVAWRKGLGAVLWFQAIAFASDAAVLWLIPGALVDSYLDAFRPAGDAEWLALAGVAVIAAPILEELVFRGFLLSALKQRFGIRNAVIGGTLLFALVHLKPIQIFAALPLGLMLAAYVARGGSLYVTIAAHMLGNGFSFLGLLFPGTPWISADWRPDTASGLGSLMAALLLLGRFLKRYPPA